MKRKHGDLDYCLSQFLNEYGRCSALYRERSLLHDINPYIKSQVVQCAEHVFFRCETWQSLNERVIEKAGTSLTP